MAATIDTGAIASFSIASGAGPFSFNCTCGASDNLLLVVAGQDQQTAAAPPTGITYNGVALTLLDSLSFTNNGRNNLSLWYLLNPPTGSAYAVVVTNTNATSGSGYAAIPVSGVDTVTPFATDVLASGATANASVTASGGASKDVYIGSIFAREASTAGSGANQSNLVSLSNINTLRSFVVDTIPGIDAGAFSWSTSATDWVVGAVAVLGSGPTVIVTANTWRPAPSNRGPFNNQQFTAMARAVVSAVAPLDPGNNTSTASSLNKWVPFRFASRLRCLQQGTLNTGNTRQNAANLLATCITNANGTQTFAKWNVLRAASTRPTSLLWIKPSQVPGFVSPPAV